MSDDLLVAFLRGNFDAYPEILAAADEIERLRTAVRCAQAVGLDWRMDWSFFDGRTLRDQMDDLDKVVSGEWTEKQYRDMHVNEW